MSPDIKKERVQLHWHCEEFYLDEPIKVTNTVQAKTQESVAKRCCIPKYYIRRCLSGSTKENFAGSDPQRWTCRECNLTICTRCLQGSLLIEKDLIEQDITKDPHRIHIERIRHSFRSFYAICRMKQTLPDFRIQQLLLD